MKIILSLIIGGALAVSGFGQTRNVLVGTNNAVVQPTNFWSADAINARAGLGLGTAATNPASAFQPSSLNLSNVSANNGGGLTNLQATNLVGIIPASNISSVTFTNISGTLSIASGGTGATNAANARQNLGSTVVGDAVFIATNAAAARTAIGALAADGDATNLTNFPANILRTNGSGSGLTNLAAANISGSVAIVNGGTGATNAATARTNLGLGWSALTNTNAANFRNAIGLGVTNIPVFENGVNAPILDSSLNLVLDVENYGLYSAELSNTIIDFSGTNVVFRAPLLFFTNTHASASRTNLGLPWSGLTNTNAATFQTALFGTNTNPVLVNTNGEVVSPTNFWQAAPLVTTFIESQPTTNQTTNIAAGRNLHIHSIAFSTVGITNTIALPTTNSFNGDIALVVHQGPTSSVTAVRTAGAATNLITLNQFEEAVEFVYYNSVWQFNHNNAFIEPIYFSGTNALANAAASRTNLGLGATWLTNTNVTNFCTAIGLGETSEPQFQAILLTEGTNTFTLSSLAGVNRTNLGLGLPALTNTNNANFQAAVFTTNAAPTNSANVNGIGFNTAVAWMEVTVSTNGTNHSFRIPLFR